MIRFIFSLLTLLVHNSFASAELNCKRVGVASEIFSVDQIQIQIINSSHAQILLNTSAGTELFPSVECKTESIPDDLFSCEHERFVFILSLNEKLMPAALNPFFFEKKKYGPFYFNCDDLEK